MGSGLHDAYRDAANVQTDGHPMNAMLRTTKLAKTSCDRKTKFLFAATRRDFFPTMDTFLRVYNGQQPARCRTFQKLANKNLKKSLPSETVLRRESPRVAQSQEPCNNTERSIDQDPRIVALDERTKTSNSVADRSRHDRHTYIHHEADDYAEHSECAVERLVRNSMKEALSKVEATQVKFEYRRSIVRSGYQAREETRLGHS
ncbi:hypothetical protein R3P38DRAFT_2801372 [Favolaschia claudopus]|uniref:Uncharacterized protein n=1 Tax=Favolaschia claudopus TaxID=2862362 RepID=A0AAV9ZVL8_9AGAR